MSDLVAAPNSAEIDYATIDGSRVGAVMIVITEGAASADTATEKKAATKTITEGAASKDSISNVKAAVKTFIEGVGAADNISKSKAAIKSFYEGMANSDALGKFKTKFHIFTEGSGNLDSIVRFFRPYYQRLGGILTNLVACTVIGTTANMSLPNVVGAKWTVNNTWLGLPIPYGKIKWNQINSYKGTLTLTCVNADALYSVLGQTLALNPETTKRAGVTITIVAQKANGAFLNFQFNNCLINPLETSKVTEKTGETHFKVLLTYTGFMESG
jgi:Tfp pilus assembly protein PilV